MRLLVCGTRIPSNMLTWTIVEALDELRLGSGDTLIVGGCTGADAVAERYAKKYDISVLRFVPDWTVGPKAGPIRNQRMLDEGRPDRVMAFHTDERLGKGTRDMVRRAKKAGVPVEVFIVPGVVIV